MVAFGYFAKSIYIGAVVNLGLFVIIDTFRAF